MKRNDFISNIFSISIVLLVFALSPYFLAEATFTNSQDINSESVFHSLNYTPSDQIVILSDSDFANYSLPGNGTKSNPYIIEGLNFTGFYGDEECIRIESTTKHFVIQNCLFTYSSIGIFLGVISSGTVKIQGNSFSGITQGAINALYVESAYVFNNTITKSDTGIYFHYAVNTTICYNTITNSIDNFGYAIAIRQSRLTNIYNNTINKYGIGLQTNNSGFIWFVNNTVHNCHFAAVQLDEIRSSLIAGNNIYNLSTSGGIESAHSANNEICYNTFTNLSHYPVDLKYSDDMENLIHHNNFLDNQYVTSQGNDNGENNLWYDPEISEGNYWSDWTGVGVYDIDGTSNKNDSYPLASPVNFDWSKIRPFPYDDTYEENDEFHQADILSLATIHNLRCLDDDYFILEPIRFNNINITLSFEPNDAYLAISLYDSDENQVANGHYLDTNTKFLSYHCVEPGIFYLKVSPGGMDSQPANYTLEFVTYPGEILDDTFEENDSFETATTISETNVTYLLLYADFDYFKIDLEKKSNVYISIAFDNSIIDLDLYLLPNDYTGDPDDILEKSETQFPAEVIEFLVNKSDTYIIFVRSIDIDGIPIIPVDYFISVQVILNTIGLPFIQITPVFVILLAIAIYRKKK